jgi:hypothetical protein
MPKQTPIYHFNIQLALGSERHRRDLVPFVGQLADPLSGGAHTVENGGPGMVASSHTGRY